MSLVSVLAVPAFALLLLPQQPTSAASPRTASAGTPGQAAATEALGTPLSPPELAHLLPPSVFFRGQTAPIQLRNAAAVRFAPESLCFAALVDNSGYSSGVQEVYQFYFVTETAVRFAGKPLPAGAYGGGYLADGTFILMDIGGHPVLRGPVSTDSALQHPRPLVMVPQSASAVRLYLGRRFVEISSAAGS